MDWTALSLSIVSGILGISAVAAFMNKYMPMINKWTVLAKDAIETLSDISSSLKDGALSADEIKKLETDVAQFKTDLAIALGK